MERVFIIDALRTPTGRLMGKLSSLAAPQIASIVIRELARRSGLKPKQVDEVIMGNVLSAGAGQNPARQGALLGGLADTTAAYTVNKVCASGLKAVTLGVQTIQLGEADTVIAGGMESMSNAPFLLRDMRRGRRYGNTEVVDEMIYDGLWDCYYDAHMGALCELTVKRYSISRQEQDAFALRSHKKAMAATEKGLFKDEIVPVHIDDNGERVFIDRDETIRWDTSMKKLAALKPAFKEGGTVTAGSSPGLNDGASVLLLMSESRARALKLTPMAEVIGYSAGHVDPKWYTIAPVHAVRSLLKKTDLKIEDIDLFEENEAFAAQTIAVAKELGIDQAKLNVNGGAIALGHPIGSSGSRIVVTLVHALRQRKKKIGLATLCLGGGGAVSMAVRAL